MANYNRRKNSLHKIKIDGIWYSEEREIRQGVMEAFKKMLVNRGERRVSPMGLELSRIDELEASRLEAPFSEENIIIALFELRGHKALGPDGFTTVF